MSELKTLKDLELLDKDLIFKKELRQEAIKEIKEIKQHGREGKDFFFNDNFIIINHIEEKAIIEYIMWKNNITEEDLK